MTLTTHIDSTVFTSAIPDLRALTVCEKVYVCIVDGDDQDIYSAELFSHGGEIVITDMRGLIEMALRQNGKRIDQFTVTISGNDDEQAAVTFTAVFCEPEINIEARDFIANSFMTSYDSRRTYRNAREQLCLIAVEGENVTAQYKVVLKYGDVYRTHTFDGSYQTMEDTGLLYIDVSYETVKYMTQCQEMENAVDIPDDIVNAWDDIVAWTVYVGNRSSSFYLDPGECDITMLFENIFGIDEYANIACVTTSKNKVSKSNAIVKGCIRNYDCRLEKSFECITAPLSRAESRWLQQLNTSRNVRLAPAGLSNVNAFPTIVFDEGDMAISDSDEEPSSLSFSWRFADERDRLYLPNRNYSRIHSDEFDKTFD